MKYSIIIAFIFLIGCSKSEPVTLTKLQDQYIGVWQSLHEVKTDTTLDIKNMLFEIHPDSTAAYRKCDVNMGNSSWSLNSRTYVSLSDANISGLTEDKITLEQPAWFFNFHYNLTITKAPFLDNGHWYLEVDNTLLKKLEEAEIGSTNWACPETGDEKKQDI